MTSITGGPSYQNYEKVNYAIGTLEIDGTDNDDYIGITKNGSNYLVNVNGYSTEYVSVDRFVIRSGAGNDFIDFKAMREGDASVLVFAGSGMDEIYGGYSEDVINGESGNDMIVDNEEYVVEYWDAD